MAKKLSFLGLCSIKYAYFKGVHINTGAFSWKCSYFATPFQDKSNILMRRATTNPSKDYVKENLTC